MSDSAGAPVSTPDTPEATPLRWEAIPLCILSGVSMTLSAVVLAYPSYQESRNGRQYSKLTKSICGALNLAFTFTGVLLGQMVAVQYGPVAVCFPISAGANLLSNLLIQSYLGIAQFSKNVVVGTLVLTCAVATVKDVGPEDVGHMDNEEVLKMLASATSLLFIIFGFISQLVAIYALKTKLVSDNNQMLFLYAYVGAVGTVLNGGIGKLISMDLGEGFGKYVTWAVLGIAYAYFSVLCLGVGMMANGTLEDPSRYVPVSTGMNLVMTCFGGICIWGDGARIEFPLTYGLVYLIVILAVYDISTFDFSAVNDERTVNLVQQTNTSLRSSTSKNTRVSQSFNMHSQDSGSVELEAPSLTS